MDIVQAVSGYITKMVSAGDSAAAGTSAAKMKILLLDNDTVGLSAPPASRMCMCSSGLGLNRIHCDDPVRPPEP
jgi:hypothetical protein